MEFTVAIPVYNGREVLRQCLSSVHKNIKNIDFEVIVCDDGSIDGTYEMVQKEFPQVQLLINPKNLGVSASMNRIRHLPEADSRRMRGRYFLRLDADSKVLPGSAAKLIDFLEEHPRAGIVAPMLVDENDNFQRNYQEKLQRPIWWLGEYALWFSKLLHFVKSKTKREFSKKAMQVSVLGSAAILVRKEVFAQVGFDENIPFFMEDADFTMEIRNAGWEAWYCPDSRMQHLGGHSDEKYYIHCRDRSLQGLYFFTQKHFPGKLNQIVLAFSILTGSTISLILAILAWVPSRFNVKAKIITDRAMRSFGNVFVWHGRKLKT